MVAAGLTAGVLVALTEGVLVAVALTEGVFVADGVFSARGVAVACATGVTGVTVIDTMAPPVLPPPPPHPVNNTASINLT